jgi:hypothetical protein
MQTPQWEIQRHNITSVRGENLRVVTETLGEAGYVRPLIPSALCLGRESWIAVSVSETGKGMATVCSTRSEAKRAVLRTYTSGILGRGGLWAPCR